MATKKQNKKLPSKLDINFFKEKLDYDTLKLKVLESSYKNNLSHIPSALSMLRYLSIMVPLMRWKYPEYEWVAGKQFGQQSFYSIYETLKEYGLDNLIPQDGEEVYRPLLLNNINKEFVFIEETLGNSIGIAIGLALSQKRPIWINLSDSVFQMGRIQEALRVISHHQLNIFITIDGNGCTRCISEPKDAYQYYGRKNPSEYVQDLFIANNIESIIVPAYHPKDIKNIFDIVEEFAKKNNPRAIYFDTIKGDGVFEFETDPVGWHYKKMSEKEYNQIISGVKK